MRHNNHRHTLGVTKEHRAAMLSNLAVALILHGRIKTTLSKARALRPFIEKIITNAKKAAAATDKKDALHQRRVALTKVRDQAAIALLFDEKVAEFTNRVGGYTRIYKLSAQRSGDAAELALIEFVKADDAGYKKPKKKAAKAATPVAAEVAAAPVVEVGTEVETSEKTES